MLENMFSEMITACCLVIILVFGVGYIKDINVFIRTNEVARKNILKMETTGELTNQDKYVIEKELERINLKDINVVSNKASNGDEVFFRINYKQQIKRMQGTKFTEVWEDHNIERSSTAKN